MSNLNNNIFSNNMNKNNMKNNMVMNNMNNNNMNVIIINYFLIFINYRNSLRKVAALIMLLPPEKNILKYNYLYMKFFLNRY